MFRGVFNRSGRLYYRYRADPLSKCWAAIEASTPVPYNVRRSLFQMS